MKLAEKTLSTETPAIATEPRTEKAAGRLPHRRFRKLSESIGREGGLLLAATLVQAIGQGLSVACGVFFFVDLIGLSPGDVSTTRSAAALAAMAFGLLAGQLADRWGARNTMIWLSLATACAVASYTLVSGLLGFVLVQLLVSSFQLGSQIGGNTLVGETVRARARFRAYQRSAQNVGMSVGTVVAVVPLWLDNRAGYLAVMITNAAALGVSALLVRALPDRRQSPRPRQRGNWRALRDQRYVAVGLLSGLMETRYAVLTVSLPLWIVNDLQAPRALFAVLLLVNTVTVILFQAWAAARADTVERAAVTFRHGGIALATGCGAIGSAVVLSGGWAVTVLVAAVLCFTVGEMWTAASSWTFSYELGDPDAAGQYQGVFELASGVGTLASPVLATAVALSLGTGGWLLAGAVFVAVGGCAERLTRSVTPAPRAALREV